jgi:hypothetical protein
LGDRQKTPTAILGRPPARHGVSGPIASTLPLPIIAIHPNLESATRPTRKGWVILDKERHMANPAYSFRTISVPGAAGTYAISINSSGHIAGGYSLTDPSTEKFGLHGFLLRQGVFTTINFPGAAQTYGESINDGDSGLGSYVGYNGTESDYVRTGRNFESFALAGAVQTFSSGIDNALNIVGSYYDSGGKRHGFLFFHNTGNFDIVAFPGAVSTSPAAMYDQNIVGWYSNTDASGTPSVGTQSFLLKGSALSDGNYTSINVPGASFSTPNGVNVYGDIVGVYADSGGLSHSFVYSGGSFATIDFPGAAAGTTYAYAINANGEIVGQYNDPILGGTFGFLAIPVTPAVAAALKAPISRKRKRV